jgi:hypothetical protein
MKQRKAQILFNKVINRLKGFDAFGTPVTLNVDGESSVKSLPGFIFTWFTFAVLKFYLFRKIDVMREKAGYTVQSNTVFNAFGSDHRVTFGELGFKFAWAVENHITH